MKTKQRLFTLLLSALLLLVALPFFAACDNETIEPNTGEYEFVFEGSGTFSDGVDYHITIRGNHDQTFLLTIKELPLLEMDGTWVLVENKGYKFYLNDYDGTYVYTTYDTTSKVFTAKVPVNLSEGLGRKTVTMTYQDAAFAAVYDGVGLPPHPPTFTGFGYGGSNGNSVYNCQIICREDGTCVSVTDKSGTADREGTYTYDAETDTYYFEFADEEYDVSYIKSTDEGMAYYHTFGSAAGGTPSKATTETLLQSDGFPRFNTSTWYYDADGNKVETEFKTTYDAETKTYTLIYEAFCHGFCDRLVTYTLED